MILRNILKNLREEFGSGIYFAKEQIDVLKPQLRADYYFFWAKYKIVMEMCLAIYSVKNIFSSIPKGLDFNFSFFYESDYLAFTLQQRKVNFSKNGFLYQYISPIIGCKSPPSTNKAQLALYASSTYLFL